MVKFVVCVTVVNVVNSGEIFFLCVTVVTFVCSGEICCCVLR